MSTFDFRPNSNAFLNNQYEERKKPLLTKRGKRIGIIDVRTYFQELRRYGKVVKPQKIGLINKLLTFQKKKMNFHC